MSAVIDPEQFSSVKNLPPSFKDDPKTRLILANYQADLIEEDRPCSIPGASEIVEGTIKLIAENSANLTYVVPTMLNHAMHQIFFSPIWVNDENRHPKVGTVISQEDFKDGVWRLSEAASWNGIDNDVLVQEMVEKYFRSWKDGLEIQPFHCLHGTAGQSLDPRINESRFIHSMSRRYAPEVEMYNSHPLFYSSSVFGSGVGAGLNQRFLMETMSVRRVFFAGFRNVIESAEVLANFYEKAYPEKKDDDSEGQTLEIYIISDLCSEEIPTDRYGFQDKRIVPIEVDQFTSLLSI